MISRCKQPKRNNCHVPSRTVSTQTRPLLLLASFSLPSLPANFLSDSHSLSHLSYFKLWSCTRKRSFLLFRPEYQTDRTGIEDSRACKRILSSPSPAPSVPALRLHVQALARSDTSLSSDSTEKKNSGVQSLSRIQPKCIHVTLFQDEGKIILT